MGCNGTKIPQIEMNEDLTGLMQKYCLTKKEMQMFWKIYLKADAE